MVEEQKWVALIGRRAKFLVSFRKRENKKSKREKNGSFSEVVTVPMSDIEHAHKVVFKLEFPERIEPPTKAGFENVTA